MSPTHFAGVAIALASVVSCSDLRDGQESGACRLYVGDIETVSHTNDPIICQVQASDIESGCWHIESLHNRSRLTWCGLGNPPNVMVFADGYTPFVFPLKEVSGAATLITKRVVLGDMNAEEESESQNAGVRIE